MVPLTPALSRRERGTSYSAVDQISLPPHRLDRRAGRRSPGGLGHDDPRRRHGRPAAQAATRSRHARRQRNALRLRQAARNPRGHRHGLSRRAMAAGAGAAVRHVFPGQRRGVSENLPPAGHRLRFAAQNANRAGDVAISRRRRRGEEPLDRPIVGVLLLSKDRHGREKSHCGRRRPATASGKKCEDRTWMSRR